MGKNLTKDEKAFAIITAGVFRKAILVDSIFFGAEMFGTGIASYLVADLWFKGTEPLGELILLSFLCLYSLVSSAFLFSFGVYRKFIEKSGVLAESITKGISNAVDKITEL